jgi:hypothetical protein
MFRKGIFKLAVALLVLLSVCLFGSGSKAEPLQTRITPADGAAQDSFGGSVCIAGAYAIVGTREDDDNGSNSGAAYIFERDGTVWTQQAKLTPSDGAAEDQFGHSVAISGDYALVGAPYDDDNGAESGAAYVFKRDGTVWMQQAKLKPVDGAAEDFFGASVSIDDDYVLIGVPGDDDHGSGSGATYIFKRDVTSWSEQNKLMAGDGQAADRLGASVSLSDIYALVGAPGDDGSGSGSGAAYVFKRDVADWTQEAKLTADDGAAEDRMGTSVSLSGMYAIVGAPEDDDNGSESGSAYLFERDGNLWTEVQKLRALDASAEDFFGESVSIAGAYAAVGAPGDDGHGSGSGAAYVFKLGVTDWVQQDKLTASDGLAGDRLGECVAISGSDVIVGAVEADILGQDSGAAYVYFPEGIFGRLTTDVTGTTGSPVVGATITIQGTAYTTVSDVYGLYRFVDIMPGTYSLIITKPQFSRQTVSNVVVTAGQLTVVDDQELTILNCDANSDNLLGIEDAINILQIQSGLR